MKFDSNSHSIMASVLLKGEPEAIAKILADILEERARQDVQWGGPEHDDGKTPCDWADTIKPFVSCLEQAVDPDCGYDSRAIGKATDKRATLVKIAAVAVAALESMDRSSHA